MVRSLQYKHVKCFLTNRCYILICSQFVSENFVSLTTNKKTLFIETLVVYQKCKVFKLIYY